MGYFLLKYFAYIFVKLFWGGKITGIENIPKKGSFIIAANHSSYLDFILLFCFIPRKIRFLAAEKFFRSKYWLPIMKITGQIRVDRNFSDKKEVYIEVKKLFKQQGVLGIFPEGTRSRSGEIQKAYSGVAKFAFEYDVPVLPVGIIGAYEAFPPDAKYPKFHKVNINIGLPISVKTNNFEHETLCVMKSISKLSGKFYGL